MREEIRNFIQEYIARENAQHPDTPLWKNPLSAFLRADDPGLEYLKHSVSPNHLLPSDILQEARSIICYFIPFTEAIVKSNIPGRLASREWAEAYILTNALIGRINTGLAALLSSRGYETGLIPATHNFNEETLVSDWSHRHLAHLAGLGSFGINNMLITDNGCCGRLGSIVTTWDSGPSPAPDGTSQGLKEKCLKKRNGSCGVCLSRCVHKAYPGGSFNRFICYEMCLENARVHQEAGYADVCGKCLTGLPCSMTDPSQ